MTIKEALHEIPHIRYHLESDKHKEALDELEELAKHHKTGHWIDHQMDRWIYAKCSECKTIHDVKSNYCPNCGADMRENNENQPTINV